MSNVNKHSPELSHESEKQSIPIEHHTHEFAEKPHEYQAHHESHHRDQERAIAEQEAHDIAPSVKDFRASSEHIQQPHPSSHTPMSRGRAFNKTMKYIRAEMTPSERAFSKFIHNPIIEKTSDILAVTIARPNALLAGSIGAFSLTLAIYIFAKNVGYPLSGFEPIAAFIIGWIGGFLYDYLHIMVTGKR